MTRSVEQHPTARALAHSGGETLTEKLRSLAERPAALTVRELIDRCMRDYEGRDTTRAQRLAAWLRSAWRLHA